jgi:uncharacterized caspase-like protein
VEEIRRLQRRFERVEALVLQDSRASRHGILDARAFLEQTAVDDHVIMLFAGHGTLSGTIYHFLPSDFDPAAVARTSLSYDDIELLMDGIAARRRLVLLDTCHAGEADEPSATTREQELPTGVQRVRSFRDLGMDSEPVLAEPKQLPTLLRLQDIFADLRTESGAYVIAAAGAAEYAREYEGLRNGVFTSSVIQGLRLADRDDDRTITVTELHRFVTDNVLALTGGRQHPVSRRENMADDFPVI